MGGMEKGLAPATWRCCCKGYALRAIEDLDGKATIFMAGFGKKYGYGVGVLPGGKEEGREGGLCFRFTTNLCWEGPIMSANIIKVVNKTKAEAKNNQS
ncbi:hypothetical protein ACFX2I_016815 [Malus domestica]